MQFSLRWLLVLVALAALVLMMLLVLPDVAAFWNLLGTVILVPSLAIPVIVYARGRARAFAIGIVSCFALTPVAFWFLPLAITIGGPSRVFDDVGSPEEIKAWIWRPVRLGGSKGKSAERAGRSSSGG